MTSLKHGYLHTHIIEKVESVKMSTWSEMYSDEEEERIVTRIGGKARGLVQAVRRIQRERGRAGRALPNSQMAPDVGKRLQTQEVCPPCGWEIEKGLGRLQTWGKRNQSNAQDNQQTAPKERPRTRVRARARPGIPPPTSRLPHYTHSPMGCFMAPTDALTVKMSQTTFSPCHLAQLMILTPHPIIKTYFPWLHPLLWPRYHHGPHD